MIIKNIDSSLPRGPVALPPLAVAGGNPPRLTDYLDLFRMLFDANLIGVTIADPSGAIIYYNDAQGRLDELEPATVLGQSICDVYHFSTDDSPTMQVLHTGKAIYDNVHFYRTRHGKLVNSTCDIYPLRLGGELLGAMCFIQGYSVIGRQMHALPEDGYEPDGPQSPAGNGKSTRYRFSSLVGRNRQLEEAVSLATQASKTASPVMLVGETGVGKEIFAQSIHYASPRGKYPYTAINCSAVPENLLEGILFGTTRGSFTGAINKAGLFEVTQKGTLFFDELDSMPLPLQSKLLRVLQEKQVRRIGGTHELDVDVRIISSVSRNPADLVAQGLLRPDFYYRLGVVKVFIPPLRRRMDDVNPLVQYFLRKHSEALGIEAPLITPEVMAAFYGHSWPGNVRELEHAIEASLNVLKGDACLDLEHLRRACPDIAVESSLGKSTPWLAYQAKEQQQGHAGPGGTGGTGAAGPNKEAGGSIGRSGGERDIDGGRKELPGTLDRADMAELPEMAKLTEFLPERDKPASTNATGESLRERKRRLERDAITQALKASAGNLALAARLVGLSPQLMHYKVKKYGIIARDYVPESL